jgi:hypothetical protein
VSATRYFYRVEVNDVEGTRKSVGVAQWLVVPQPWCCPQGVNGLDFVRRDVEKRAEDRIADLVKKAMHNKISADSNRADFALAA